MFSAGRRKRFIGALDNALRADVDPASGSHLAVHGKLQRLEAVELITRRPMWYQIRVGNEHARRGCKGTEYPHRVAGLNEQRLVIFQAFQRSHDGMKFLPVSRCSSRSTVHNKLARLFCNLFIEVVHQHPHCRFLMPSLAAECRATRRADRRVTHERSSASRMKSGWFIMRIIWSISVARTRSTETCGM